MKVSLLHLLVRVHAMRFGLAMALAVGYGAQAGHAAAAESAGKKTTDPNDVPRSTYSNLNSRPDPFLPVKLKGRTQEARAVVTDQEFHLQGILWDPVKPTAIINRQRVVLNATVVLKLGMGECTVTAAKIERDRVVLKMGNREVELQLER